MTAPADSDDAYNGSIIYVIIRMITLLVIIDIIPLTYWYFQDRNKSRR